MQRGPLAAPCPDGLTGAIMPAPQEFHTADGQPPVALVTGGARRIGAAFVEALAAEGFQLAIHCNRSRAEAEALAARIAATGAPPPIVVAADHGDGVLPQRLGQHIAELFRFGRNAQFFARSRK